MVVADTGDRPDEVPPRFDLFVAGDSPRSDRAIQNLRRIVEEHLGPECEVDVIDVVATPRAAEEDRILATPTLIKRAPPPVRRITGDLSDTDRVLELIGMPGPAPPRAKDAG